jgi:hypothetical protein
VGVVFHLPFHEGLFGETKRELLMEAGEVALLQRNAPVGVVFHLLLHEELFGKTKEELLIEAEEVAPLQRKKRKCGPSCCEGPLG